MANVSTRQTAINQMEPGPSNVATSAVPLLPTQVLEVGNTGIINLSVAAITAANKATQTGPAIVLPTSDPNVPGALWANGSQAALSGQSTGNTSVVTISNSGTQTLTFVNGILTAHT